MKLNELKDNPGARQNGKRVGRGVGSGKGKTAGRGYKGQKSRSGGGVMPGFEGGQFPLYKRIPMRGFKNLFGKQYTIINVSGLQQLVDNAKLQNGQTVTAEVLKSAGYTKKIAKDGLKVLGNGEISVALNIEAAAATKSAKQKIESAGGSLNTAS